ncbi:hypothetical protein BDEG_26435 [Batrachochytrium dendrobatidis JEL423]|uniref:Probable lysosomal cobalamin transporter n=1 Tax=Batrachochytrium dendrobatidis (strain JEL423) TaxID=403673 RepID=A0A177WUE8_BATDL|nr:hypothetical protein BDEG_26435 [Batrachochytrium dendrobatidis JEL423]
MRATWEPWALYAFLTMGGFGAASGMINWLQHKREYDGAVTNTVGIALGIALSIVALVPIDIYIVSSTSNIAIGAKHAWATSIAVLEITSTIKILYYILFGMLALICFGVLPFMYFYSDDKNNLDDLYSTPLHKAFALSAVPAGILVVLMLIGAYMRLPPILPTNTPWFNSLLVQNGYETGISFIIGIISFVGLIVMVTHVAYGLSHAGLFLIHQKRKELDDIDVIGSLNNVRSCIDALHQKYPGSNAERRMKAQDRRKLQSLQSEQRYLENRLTTRIPAVDTDNDSLKTIQQSAEAVGGVLLLAMAIVFVISIMATLIDHALRSCGAQCSFLVTTFGTVTILDAMLYAGLNMFSIDVVLVLVLAYYMIGCIFYMMKQYGVGVVGFSLYSLAPGSTLPQALVLFTSAAIVSVPAWIYLMIIAAPQYMAFGAQTVCNVMDSTGKRNCTLTPAQLYSCQFTSPVDVCTPSIISTLVSRYLYTLPLFGTGFYSVSWIFCIVVCIGVVMTVWSPQKKPLDQEHAHLITNASTVSRR